MFKTLLSAKARAELDQKHQTIKRLYSLSDRWLAEEILTGCRTVRRANPRISPIDHTYDASFLWHLVPEIARRLGVQRFESNERSDAQIVMATGAQLRNHVGYAIRWISQYDLGPTAEVRLLLNEPCNGNPVVFALDRFALPLTGTDDVIARSILEIAGYRDKPCDGRWTPAMDA